MASRIDYSQNRKLYVGTTSELSVADGDAIISGNVGIGATSPGVKLRIKGAGSSINSQTDVMAIIQNSTYDSGDNSGENKLIFGWSNHYAAAISAYKDGAVNRTGLKFYTEVGYNTPVESMRIDSSGKVSVGSPISGQLGVRGTTNDSTAYSFEAANSSGNTLLIVRNDGEVWMPSGNVGIGTTSPGSKLTVNPSSAGQGALRLGVLNQLRQRLMQRQM